MILKFEYRILEFRWKTRLFAQKNERDNVDFFLRHGAGSTWAELERGAPCATHMRCCPSGRRQSSKKLKRWRESTIAGRFKCSTKFAASRTR
jgi:hypothetical protein